MYLPYFVVKLCSFSKGLSHVASLVFRKNLQHNGTQFHESVGHRLGYGLDDQGFESRQGLGIFLYTTASRPVLGPTQPPIQWVPGALSLRVK
jgi:hypothetical protein